MAHTSRFGTVLAAAAAIALAGCSTHREFRVAGIGSDGSFEIAGDEDSSTGTAPVGGKAPLVTSGNLLIGGGRSGSGTLGGTVIGTLTSTDQTVIQLVSGTTVLLDGLGGTFGDVVAIDLNAGRVVGGPSSLLGLGVVDGSAATLVAAGGSGGASLVQTGGGTSATATVTGTATGAGTLLPRTSATGNITGSVTNTASGALSPVLGKPCC